MPGQVGLDPLPQGFPEGEVQLDPLKAGLHATTPSIGRYA